MVAEATAPRRENVPRHILFYNIAVAFLYYTRTDVRFAKEIFLSGFLFFRTVLQKDDIMSESESTCLHD